jgi:integrase
MRHYRDVIEPEMRGVVWLPDLTLAAFVPVYLDRHGATVRPRTVQTLRERLAYATRAFGEVPLSELERMSGELAGWRSTLPERSRYPIMSALRQALGAAVRWGYLTTNPAVQAGRNPQPSPRAVRAYSPAELDALAAELSPEDAALVRFAAATGLRPEEWAALTRADVDRAVRVVHVRRTVSDGTVVELGKTSRSLREVPLSARALDAISSLPPRLDTPLLFPAPRGGLRDLHNWRRRVWHPAVQASGIARPARIYDLRSTFVSDCLAAGVGIFTVAKIAGTSVQMIERHYGALLDGAGDAITARLDALDAERGVEAERLGH